MAEFLDARGFDDWKEWATQFQQQGLLTLSEVNSILGGYVPSSRAINTTAPLAGGGNLTADRTLFISTNGIGNALLRQSAALSVVGRSANSIGDVADIIAGADTHVLRRAAGILGFGTITTASISDFITSGDAQWVKKSGDTMAGDLTFEEAAGVQIKNEAGSVRWRIASSSATPDDSLLVHDYINGATALQFVTGASAGLVHAPFGFHAGSYSSTKHALYGYKNSATEYGLFLRQDNTSGRIATFSGSGGVERLVFPEGGGIKFPATQAASSDPNNLDDYEFGTWTPVVTGASGGVLTTYTAYGRYVKLGDVVAWSVEITLTNIGTAGGQAMVFSFPFSGTSNPRSNMIGGEWNSTGKAMTGVIGGSSSYCLEYNGAPPFTNGYVWTISGHLFV